MTDKIITNETTLTSKITTGSAVLLSILAIVLSGGLVGQDNVYVCLDSQLALQCDKLSGVNADGIQTRCYYEDEIENITRYKNCKTGWLPYTPQKEREKLNLTDKIYLVCQNKNSLINECQIIDSNETVYKIGVNK